MFCAAGSLLRSPREMCVLEVMVLDCGCCRKQAATPEDIEYYVCQKEMMFELCKSHQDVERIIGETAVCLFCAVVFCHVLD